VHYTYGAAGAAFNRAGRVVQQEDASGAQEFFYGPLGETVKNVRTIVIPKFGTQTYVTQWTYDTWNRLTSMIYPDSEAITYTYNLGGLLNAMNGNRQGQDYSYVQQLGYDQFESRVFLSYGNGTQTTYSYEPDRRRLQNMLATTGNGRRIMDNSYVYDKESNILSLTNNAPVPSSNLMGGSSQYSYTYDDLYRLTTANGMYKGPNEQDRYSMTMEYNTVGGITRKAQTSDKTNGPGGNKWIPQKKTTYDLTYTYGAQQPHTATHIGNQTYTYDANGNQTGWTSDLTGQRQNLVWDEENRLRSVSVNGQLNSYVYDAAGERVLKGQGTGQSVFVNGDLKAGSGGVGNFTVYVNPFLVVQSGQYSKHYFIESQRITTRLELGWQQQVSASVDTTGYSKKEQKILQGIARDQQAVQRTGQQQVTAVTGANARGVVSSNGQAGGNGNGTTGGSANTTNNGNHYAYGHYKGHTNTTNQSFLYFYHTDHLGSTSYVTDDAGEVYEHMEYFAYGEIFVQEHSNTNRTPYLFNGKELDEETGLYYFGARYFDPRTSIWQSVDPKADEMPAWSPYNYALGNPVKLVDPDGMKPTGDYYNEKGILVGNDKKNDNKIYVIKTTKTTNALYGSGAKSEKGNSNPISAKDAAATEKKIKAGQFDNSVMNNVVEIEPMSTLKQMKTEVSKDNGKGGTSAANNTEYGGLVFKHIAIPAKPGPASDPSKRKNASISSTLDLTFHSHPSGTKKVNLGGGGTGIASWVQPPSNTDISNAKGTQYVFGMQSKTLYIYNKSGVIATVPQSIIK
jgi:RHS repeat-associated protein